jgi:hypothetical protein
MVKIGPRLARKAPQEEANMQTMKVMISNKLNGNLILNFTLEFIVDSENAAKQAGIDMGESMKGFMAGFAEVNFENLSD